MVLPRNIFHYTLAIYSPDIPNMYLSGTFKKLHDEQFLPITCVMLVAFIEYSWNCDSDGPLHPTSIHIPKAIAARGAFSGVLDQDLRHAYLD